MSRGKVQEIQRIPSFKYLFMDPSSGKKSVHKRVRSRAALVVCCMDNIGHVFVLDCWTGRGGAQQLAEVFVQKCALWSPRIAAFEDAGQQMLLVDPIMAEAKKQGVLVPLQPVAPLSGVDKKWRIRATLQPVIGPGRLLIQDEHVELLSELLAFPLGASQDILDALASCIMLMPPPLAQATIDNEREDLLFYLRESGAPMHIIEAEDKNNKQQWWQKITKEMGLRTTF
mgnify:CR=1 FL=1